MNFLTAPWSLPDLSRITLDPYATAFTAAHMDVFYKNNAIVVALVLVLSLGYGYALSRLGRSRQTSARTVDLPGAVDLDAVRMLVTGWGGPGLDAAILKRLPQLELVLYAGGSVKPTVTPEFWNCRIPVVFAACRKRHTRCRVHHGAMRTRAQQAHALARETRAADLSDPAPRDPKTTTQCLVTAGLGALAGDTGR